MPMSALAASKWQAVLFDLDGTLADTAGDLGEALNVLRRAQGLPNLPLQVLRPHASAGARGLIGVGLNKGPQDADYEGLRQDFLQAYADCLSQTTHLFEGMAEVLADIEGMGLPWGIVTNKPERFTQGVVEGLGLQSRASVVVSGDTTAHAKPHPLPLLHACAQLGVLAQHTLYVGDDLRDIQAARAAHMPNAAAAWGYLGDSDVHSWGADAVLAHPLALRPLLCATS